MHFDPLFLSRLQFAWVVAWHFLMPAFTVGLASFIAVMEGLHLVTKRDVYLRISIFWTKIFAVSFGMGVVSGITMPFQFGTNWSRFSDDVGDVISPLLGYEGLTAFFLEAAFLGVLLFGRKLVPRWAHFFAALMVALGTLASTFWILATNSWMQTPAGFDIVDGRFQPKDWLEIIFNPSFPYRLAHVVTAIYITTGFVVVGVAAWWLLSRRFYDEARTMLSMTLWLLTVLVPLQAVIGDQHGLDTLKYQPAKLAAIEGIWDGGRRLPWVVFAIPDDAAAKNHDEVSIPLVGSLILTHNPDGEVRGLKDFPPQDRAPVAPPFFGFRIMLACWGIMALTVVHQLVAAVPARTVRRGLVPEALHDRRADRLRRRHRRLGDDRGRPPAVDGLRSPAHRRFRFALAHRRRRDAVACRLRRRLHRDVRRRRRDDGAHLRSGADGGGHAGLHRGRAAEIARPRHAACRIGELR